MIPNQTFYCPKCGAPGQVSNGQTEYSCMCRLGTYQATGPVLSPVRVTYDCGCPGTASCGGTCCPRRPQDQHAATAIVTQP